MPLSVSHALVTHGYKPEDSLLWLTFTVLLSLMERIVWSKIISTFL